MGSYTIVIWSMKLISYKNRPRCYAESPTAHDDFQPIPDLISYTAVTERWGLLSHACCSRMSDPHVHSYSHRYVHTCMFNWAQTLMQLISVCECKVFVSSSSKCRYGEIVNINLVRDKKTGKPKGFCFLAYENQRSTVLAVDNFNGIKV